MGVCPRIRAVGSRRDRTERDREVDGSLSIVYSRGETDRSSDTNGHLSIQKKYLKIFQPARKWLSERS